MRSRAGFLVGVLALTASLGGVTANSVAAATSTTVTWKVSSLTAGQVKSLSAIATTNSTGVKTWSKTGSCTLTPKSKPTKLTMGSTGSCVLTLKIAKSGNYRAKTSSKTITRKTYKVGQTGPGGGKIFYVDLTRPAGSKYFEVACAGWSDGTCLGDDWLTDPLFVWGCMGTSIAGADGTAIGTGEQNTADIVAGCSETGIAAKVVDALVLGGQRDWFLPSKDELNVLSDFTFYHPEDWYWSSSETVQSHAWNQYRRYDMSEGFKYYLTGVRPIRSF